MRYKLSETQYCVGLFETGETVTIAIYNLATGSSVVLTDNNCAELGSTGMFKWSSANITTQPTNYTKYAYQMTDSNGLTQEGAFVLGGWEENIDAPISDIPTAVENRQEMDSNSTQLAKIDNLALELTVENIPEGVRTELSPELNLINTNLDEPISDVPSAIRTELTPELGLINTNIDDKISNVPTAVENRQEMDANSTKLANLDQSLSDTESNIRGGSETLETIKNAVDNIEVDNAAIADAVWNESKVGHTGDLKVIADSVENIKEYTLRILGLCQENYRIVNPLYDANGNLTSSEIKIYSSKTDCDNDENALATYTLLATYDANGVIATYKVTKDS